MTMMYDALLSSSLFFFWCRHRSLSHHYFAFRSNPTNYRRICHQSSDKLDPHPSGCWRKSTILLSRMTNAVKIDARAASMCLRMSTNDGRMFILFYCRYAVVLFACSYAKQYKSLVDGENLDILIISTFLQIMQLFATLFAVLTCLPK